jgi:hypothetical protein
LLLGLLVLVLLVDMASGYFATKNNLTLDMKQLVSGEGYFMSYKAVRMPNSMEPLRANYNGVEAKDYSHGSGSINADSLLTAVASNRTEGGSQDAELMDYQEALSCIQMNDDAKLTYNPISMSIGSGYYALHPITFSSLLKEETWIKNRGGASSMQNQIEYAHGLNKQLKFLVRDFVSEEDPSVTMMNISQDITNGKAHIGILQGDPSAMEESAINPDTEEIETFELAKSAWKRPLVYVDEDYFGTMHIEKMMNLTSSVEEDTEDDDWLPCCYGGYADMNELDQKGHSADGVFDCSCFKILDKAQFPR